MVVVTVLNTMPHPTAATFSLVSELQAGHTNISVNILSTLYTLTGQCVLLMFVYVLNKAWVALLSDFPQFEFMNAPCVTPLRDIAALTCCDDIMEKVFFGNANRVDVMN